MQKHEPYSVGLQTFLSYVRACDELYRIAKDDEQRDNEETQDILHTLEMDKRTYNEVAHLGKKLAEVRRRRRNAKVTQEALLPIVEWYEANKPLFNKLGQVLGDMHKAEKRQEVRVYTARTDVLEDAIND